MAKPRGTHQLLGAARRAWPWWRGPCPWEGLLGRGAAGGASSARTAAESVSSSSGTARPPERQEKLDLKIQFPLNISDQTDSGCWFRSPCSTWGCPLYCWHQSGHLSYQTECGPRTLPSQSAEGNSLSAASMESSEHDRRAQTGTYRHESGYPRLLAVAVVKESQLALLHLPHEVARLQTEGMRISCSESHHRWGDVTLGDLWVWASTW